MCYRRLMGDLGFVRAQTCTLAEALVVLGFTTLGGKMSVQGGEIGL